MYTGTGVHALTLQSVHVRSLAAVSPWRQAGAASRTRLSRACVAVQAMPWCFLTAREGAATRRCCTRAPLCVARRRSCYFAPMSSLSTRANDCYCASLQVLVYINLHCTCTSPAPAPAPAPARGRSHRARGQRADGGRGVLGGGSRERARRVSWKHRGVWTALGQAELAAQAPWCMPSVPRRNGAPPAVDVLRHERAALVAA